MRLSRWNEKVLMILLALVLGFSSPGTAAGPEPDAIHFSPAYPEPPFQFRGNQIAVVLFKTSPEALRKLVPGPLMPMPANLIFIYFSRLTVEYGSTVYPYLEVAIGVPVMYNGQIANFYPLLYLDRAMAISGGREIWGYPKKDGDITFDIQGNRISGTLDRLGTRLIDFSLTIGGKLPPETPQSNFTPWVLKIIPSVEKGAPPEVKQITSTVIRDQKVHELYQGTGSVVFKSGEFDPLAEIPVLEIIAGSYTVGDMVFDYGKVIYDYLKQPESKKK